MISITKDLANGKKFSFAINQLTNDVASLKWVIKSSDGSVVNTSNLNAYALTLTNDGKYFVQAELISKCGDSKILSADFEAITICNLLKYDYIFRSSYDFYEILGNVIFSYNSANEVIKEESTHKYSDVRIEKNTFYYEKNEANLGSSTKPYIIRKNYFGNGLYMEESIYCDFQRRVTKRITDSETETYTYGNDGFLEQKIRLPKNPINPNIEYRTNYKHTVDLLTETTTDFDRRTNTSQVSRIVIYTYSDQVKLSKYAVNYGYNEGINAAKYFKKETNTYYDYSRSTTPSISIQEYDCTNILDKNNQPVSEKFTSNGFSFEKRNFSFDCK